ncbi:MAG: EAL domain-containing protein [Thiohalomonadaceae bacterium]
MNNKTNSDARSKPEQFDVFPWNAQLDTGIDVIDEQHHKLVEILNHLARQQMLGADAEQIHEILHELADYAEYHFTTEEAIWRRYFVDDEWFQVHEKTHQAFFTKIQLISQSDEPFEKIIEQLFSYLIQWLAFHIIDNDKRMAKAVAACEQGYDIEHAKQRASEAMSGSTSVLIQTVLSMYDHLSSKTIELIREKHARQRMEEALFDSETRWRLLVEDNQDVLWEWDTTTQDSDLRLAETLGSEGWRLPDAELTRLCRTISRLVKQPGEDSTQLHYQLLHDSGEIRHMQLRCRVVHRDENGRATRLIGIRNDASRTELAELIYQNGNDAMMVTDGNSRILSVNPAFEILTGYSEGELIGENPRMFFSDRTSPETLSEMMDSLEKTPSWKGEVWNRHRDGHEYVASLSVRRVNHIDGSPRMYVVIANDMTEHTRTRLLMEQQNQMFENALDAIDAGNWKWDIQSAELVINERWANILGYQLDELAPITADIFFDLIHPDDQSLVRRSLDAHFLDARKKYRCEIRMRHKSGDWVWILTQGKVMEYDTQGKPWKMFGVHIDINEKKIHFEHLEYVSSHDVLTGLPNRALFTDQLQREMAKLHRTGKRLAVAYIDVDDFSELNHQHGMESGNAVLINISQKLRSTMRESNLLARVGGDEFVLAILDMDESDDYIAAISRLQQQLASPQSVYGEEVPITISMGISLYPQQEPMDADQLLRQADQAMFQAKQLGKNRYHIFDAVDDQSVRHRNQSLERIREALKRNEFVLYYQPKVNMQTGELTGLEALIRWQHPERGLLAPIEFIPLIEQHPLAISVGDWVIEESLRQLAAWNRIGLNLTVSVNIAAPQLQDSHFLHRLKQQLAAQPQILSRQLELEILETAALEDMGHVAELIEYCRAIDIHFALDDFGTGYSSLNYLKQLAAQTVKIDQGFVRHIMEDADHAAIIHSIVGLSKTFNRLPLAEGVESEIHGNLLIQLGCLHGQGYGIAKPMPADAIPDWIKTWRPPLSWRHSKQIAYEHIPSLFAEIEYRAWFNTFTAVLDGRQAPSAELDLRHTHFKQWLDNPSTRDLYAGNIHFTELGAAVKLLHGFSVELLDRHAEPSQGKVSRIHSLFREILNALTALRVTHSRSSYVSS